MSERKDLYLQSEYIHLITMILKNEFNVQVVINQCHDIKMGDGNTLFYVITREKYRFLVNIMGRKVQDDKILYWVESIDHAGKVCEFFYDIDRFALTFQRGEKYNHEFLVYFYVYGNKYPALRFVPGKIYREYSKMLSRIYKKHHFILPDELRVMTAY
jgi:hypothetical protein